MGDVEIILEDPPQAADIDRLRAGLSEHAMPITGQPGFVPLAVFARESGGGLVGGAYGTVNWNWLDLSLLWVAESHRGRGLGSRLIERLESAAIRRGCRNAHLETFTYQAARLYQRHGYRQFATLEDYPPGHQKIYLRKQLVAPEAEK